MNDFENAMKAAADTVQYDIKKRRFKTLLGPVVVFASLLMAVFVVSLIVDLPGLVLLSFFSLALSAMSLVHDHWISNSTVIPFVVYFPAICVADVMSGEWFSFTLHVAISVMAMVIGTRNNVSFIVGTMASACYAAWVYTISRWLGISYYDVFSAFIPPEWQFVIVLAAGFIAVSIKAAISWRWKKEGNAIDCEFGSCPW